MYMRTALFIDDALDCIINYYLLPLPIRTMPDYDSFNIVSNFKITTKVNTYLSQMVSYCGQNVSGRH